MSVWTGLARVIAGMGALLAVAACASPHAPPPRDAVPSVAVPAHAPQRFDFGLAADQELIARWDLDVGPDGEGLPSGQGSVEQGATVFLTRCAACHGVTGTEGPNDRLVGGEAWGDTDAPRPRTIGNYWPYATTLFDYITRAMPQNNPGSLTADETYAVIAWLLARNGVVGEDTVLDASGLMEVRMPARYRFVPDDRKGGAVIR